MFNLASWRNVKAIVISFRGLLLTFVDDMFDGNMDVLVECHNFHLSFVEQKLAGLRPNVLTDFHR